MVRKFSTILFDLDGTLTDPKLGITSSIQYALKSIGHKTIPSEKLTWCIGPPLLQSFETILESKKLAKEALELYRERFTKKGLFENKTYPHIEQVLEELYDDNRLLFLATSKPTVYAEKILEHFQLSNFFKNIYGSELDGTNSDKTELLSYIIDEEKLDPITTVMIGDRKHDVIGAENNNIASIGVLYGYGGKKELLENKCKNFAKSPKELPIVIRNYQDV